MACFFKNNIYPGSIYYFTWSFDDGTKDIWYYRFSFILPCLNKAIFLTYCVSLIYKISFDIKEGTTTIGLFVERREISNTLFNEMKREIWKIEARGIEPRSTPWEFRVLTTTLLSSDVRKFEFWFFFKQGHRPPTRKIITNLKYMALHVT